MTNFVIDAGYVLSAIVPVILLAIFKDNLEPVWRLCLGLGVVPPLSVLYCKLTSIVIKLIILYSSSKDG